MDLEQRVSVLRKLRLWPHLRLNRARSLLANDFLFLKHFVVR